MHSFASLFFQLESCHTSAEKQHAVSCYFKLADNEERIQALALLTRKGKKICSPRFLRETALKVTEIPDWLFDECYKVTGDLTETVSQLTAGQGFAATSPRLSEWMKTAKEIMSAVGERKSFLLARAWSTMLPDECLVFNKILTAGFKPKVSTAEVYQGIADAFELDPLWIAHRLNQDWSPETHDFDGLILDTSTRETQFRPYPFFRAGPAGESLEKEDPARWEATLNWRGIRCQLLKRNGMVYLWDESNQLITRNFPELVAASAVLPDGSVLDGVIAEWANKTEPHLPGLTRRKTRQVDLKKETGKVEYVLIVQDLLELGGVDFRIRPLEERKTSLEQLVTSVKIPGIVLPGSVSFSGWEDLKARFRKDWSPELDGILLKRKFSLYGEAEHQDFFLLKKEASLLLGVLLYVRKVEDLRSEEFSEFTLAVWQGESLVPVARILPSLTAEELKTLSTFVKQNTVERFGPVRTIRPEMVFEFSFERVLVSKRHKSGIVLESPQMIRWLPDALPSEAHRLEDVCKHL